MGLFRFDGFMLGRASPKGALLLQPLPARRGSSLLSSGTVACGRNRGWHTVGMSAPKPATWATSLLGDAEAELSPVTAMCLSSLGQL